METADSRRTDRLAASAPAVPETEPAGMIRGEAADLLLSAADDYHEDLIRNKILGYPDGSLREDQTVTRAGAPVMLSRAFGDLPGLVGDSARTAYDAVASQMYPRGRRQNWKACFPPEPSAGPAIPRWDPMIP